MIYWLQLYLLMEYKNLINPEQTVQQISEKILATDVGEDLVMMDIETGQYITLNKMGRIIWQEIASPVKVSELLNKLMERFQVTEEVCREDTLEYLNQMQEDHLIQVIE